MHVRVQKGTNAGWKPPMKPRPPRWWSHECWAPGFDGQSQTLRGYLVRCPDCGLNRP